MTSDDWAFLVSGLINNLTYVVFLSAATDIVSTSASGSEGIILLADIVPSLLVKLIFPQVMHRISYGIRIMACTILSFMALQIVAWMDDFGIRLFGIVLASISSGVGEISFLSLSSFHRASVLGFWGVGTGAAGVVGSFAYLCFSSWIGLSLRTTLMITSILPPIMAINYYFIMSKPHLEAEASRLRLAVNELEKDQTAGDKYTIIVDQESSADHLSDPDSNDLKPPEQMKISERFSVIIRPLIWPFMLPLFLVFWAEYTINQGVFPALLFPFESTPFKNMRDHYVYYQFIYQIGVFISRSSLRFFPVKQIFALSLAQVSVLVVLLLQALLSYIPSVYIVFIIILIEGLFGGSTYINAFHQISQTTPAIHREFAMGAAAVADTLGITMAGITSALIGPWLCHRNVLCSK